MYAYVLQNDITGCAAYNTIFFSATQDTPSCFMSTMKAEMPLVPMLMSVFAYITAQSASGAMVMKVLRPFRM